MLKTFMLKVCQKRLLIGLCLISLMGLMTSPAYAVIKVVAAENIYGSIAQELGQADVQVQSILNNPNQDPHLFSSKPSTSKAVMDADVLIFNGADYDPWFKRLLDSQPLAAATVIDVGQLVGAKVGANPHLWYHLPYIKQFAIALTREYQRRLPQQQAVLAERLQHFLAKLQPLEARVQQLEQRGHGIAVTATEPVADYLAQDLGLNVLDNAFQLAIMNDTEPSASSRAQFEQHLQHKQVRLLIYNQQVQDPVTQYMQQLAKQSGVPIVGVTELLPLDQDYSIWYQQTLACFQTALSLD